MKHNDTMFGTVRYGFLYDFFFLIYFFIGTTVS